MTDAYVAATRRSLRRSLYQRMKGLGLTQDQLIRSVAAATDATLIRANVADLAAVAAAAGPLRTALETAAPGDPALDQFDTVRSGVVGPVSDLLDPLP